jgi:hypothetical protein
MFVGLVQTLSVLGTEDHRLASEIPGYVFAVNFEITGLSLGCGFSAYLALLFFGKDRRFPRLYVGLLIALLAFHCVDTALVAGFLGVGAQDIVRLVTAALSVGLWCSYLGRSRRVANTFVK